MRRISTSIEFVGGPDCGRHEVLTVPPNGLPHTIRDRYKATGAIMNVTARFRYDWQAEHTGKRQLPDKCCAQPHRGCPLYLHRPGSTA